MSVLAVIAEESSEFFVGPSTGLVLWTIAALLVTVLVVAAIVLLVRRLWRSR